MNTLGMLEGLSLLHNLSRLQSIKFFSSLLDTVTLRSLGLSSFLARCTALLIGVDTPIYLVSRELIFFMPSCFLA